MTKRMLIDSTHEEETRVVVVDNNKLEDVEFETSNKRPIKGNVYLAKVMRVEPSLQACFVDYGGNRHGFLAYGEIHTDYYNVSAEQMAEINAEVDNIIEAKKNRFAKTEEVQNTTEEAVVKTTALKTQDLTAENNVEAKDKTEVEAEAEDKPKKKKFVHRRPRKATKESPEGNEPTEPKVLACASGFEEEVISTENKSDDDLDDDDDDDDTQNFEQQKKLLIARKLFYKNKIQDVIKEGQILLIQVIKEERGNKGAALSTYLSLAGRYCVLMPNRIKSGGVSRKITNQADRKRLKNIVAELPLNSDMSMIVRTAGEEKTKPEIVRDYNYLIRSWNNIRIAALQAKAPAMVHEEGNLIKRALRDIYTKEISEIMVDGLKGFEMARDFFKILSPNNMKKLKLYKNADMPMFQRYQVEGQLDKLHETTAQLESGGYLVINPTEALVSIDVNSGRATKEKDLEETALKTNLEACDEIAKQLRMRNLAGLIVIDFIDMEENKNNLAIERRMKEALKKDRSRIQVGKMSMFGLLELSRQRMHSSFFESNYQVCPHCQGRGIVRSIESSAVLILRSIEEEGSKNRSSKINIFVPTDIAIYLLNQKRKNLSALEAKYNIDVIISADSTICNIADFRIERQKIVKDNEVDATSANEAPKEEVVKENKENRNNNNNNRNNNNRRNNNNNNNRKKWQDKEKEPNEPQTTQPTAQPEQVAEKTEPLVEEASSKPIRKGKANWWKKLVSNE